MMRTRYRPLTASGGIWTEKVGLQEQRTRPVTGSIGHAGCGLMGFEPLASARAPVPADAIEGPVGATSASGGVHHEADGIARFGADPVDVGRELAGARAREPAVPGRVADLLVLPWNRVHIVGPRRRPYRVSRRAGVRRSAGRAPVR